MPSEVVGRPPTPAQSFEGTAGTVIVTGLAALCGTTFIQALWLVLIALAVATTWKLVAVGRDFNEGEDDAEEDGDADDTFGRPAP